MPGRGNFALRSGLEPSRNQNLGAAFQQSIRNNDYKAIRRWSFARDQSLQDCPGGGGMAYERKAQRGRIRGNSDRFRRSIDMRNHPPLRYKGRGDLESRHYADADFDFGPRFRAETTANGMGGRDASWKEHDGHYADTSSPTPVRHHSSSIKKLAETHSFPCVNPDLHFGPFWRRFRFATTRMPWNVRCLVEP